MGPSMKPLVLWLTIVAAIMFKGGETGLLPSKTTVQIVNTLAHHEDVTLHCKDKNHDLGERVLKFREMFEFSFKPNPFLKVTLYFCRFWWPILSEAHYFEIYVQERDEWQVCNWHVNYYGPCLSGVCCPWGYKYEPPSSADAHAPLAPAAASNASITHQSHS
ncbi:S-protein homolog 5-like [Neltuma alba]|uniref:S-protein homolog 5-like n=1 Tax=Neltuma alba TaxID=207710 RepID=UPI0010A39422|nr:S-protein homolog 5-like [Prosopis alba]